MGKIREEIKQRGPMPAEQEAYLNVLRSADWLTRGAAEVLKPYNLSGTQYNVLRILRGAEPEGLPCREVSERLVTREPDVTRLLDRMERGGLIARSRSENVRRVVVTRVTRHGLDVLSELDKQVVELHKRQFARFTREQLEELVHLLELVRAEKP
jgi:DNA-binding MarR family transcriptional regulator